jgi:3-mercaptopyruvate sulfurtransferase SseA
MSRSDVLVDADWAEAHIGDPHVVIVEVDEDTSAYDKGHIPGAVKIDWKKDLQDPVRRDFVDKTGFEALLSERGISDDDTVLLYGGNNNWFAAYAYWYFRLYGHDKVLLLDGGRKKWELDSRELSTDVPQRPRTSYTATEQDASLRALRDEVIDAIGKRNLVDVRSPDEFTGRLLAPAHLPQEQAQRAGHIPTSSASSTRATRDWTSARTPSRTAGSGSARRTPGSSCTSCSACPTSRTTTARGPSTGRWSACRSSWVRPDDARDQQRRLRRARRRGQRARRGRRPPGGRGRQGRPPGRRGLHRVRAAARHRRRVRG